MHERLDFIGGFPLDKESMTLYATEGEYLNFPTNHESENRSPQRPPRKYITLTINFYCQYNFIQGSLEQTISKSYCFYGKVKNYMTLFGSTPMQKRKKFSHCPIEMDFWTKKQ